MEKEVGKKVKISRKGKKAWRSKISTEDIDDYFEKSTKDVLSGGPLIKLPIGSLFYVDKLQVFLTGDSLSLRDRTLCVCVC
ncbi:hypothetical protein Vadar_010310 [Vaccinium darrowii]|uniref:Uncharacterized protein n=1 Tax=Vaccinium darrowii TaxID=229202 RepID=A0ACB7X981_9ERIC|nr:hypothetical protein Vadar_010310 [Vaccinium darrowii]